MKLLINKYKTTFVLLLLLSVLLTSCSTEVSQFIHQQVGEVGFRLEVTDGSEAEITTRGVVGTVTENRINDVIILAFDPTSKTLKLKIAGEGLRYTGTNDNICNFIALVEPLGTYDLVALANKEKFDLENIAVGVDTKATVAKKLALTKTGKWKRYENIPMWGELANYQLTPTSNPHFKMTRMLARVNVNCDPSVNNFIMTAVYVCNYNTKGYLIPDYPSKFNLANNQATAPTTYNTEMGLNTTDYLSYLDKPDVVNNKCENSIYLFETITKGNIPLVKDNPANWDPNGAWVKNPCLIIEGTYGDVDQAYTGTGAGKPNYYRIDLTENGTNCLSLLRNYSYHVLITKVKGPGYDSPDVARISAPVNMITATYTVNDPNVAQKVVEGPYFMTLSHTQVVFPVGQHNVPVKVYMKTNYKIEKCKIEVFNDKECKQPATDNWVQASQVTFDEGDNKRTEISLSLLSAKVNQYRYIKITTGRMSMVVKVWYE